MGETNSLSEISLEEEEALIEAAKRASSGSFCQMSGFAVGAAALVEDAEGKRHYVRGSNYETQNYRSVCAEKHVLQTAHLNHSLDGQAPKLLKLAVYSPDHNSPLFPCGDCRQALFEHNPELLVLSLGADGSRSECVLGDLLPHGFRLQETISSSKKPVNSHHSEQNKGVSVDDLAKYIVHFPIHEYKLEHLAGIESLIVVGSPSRSAKLAKFFRGVQPNGELVVMNEYCHLASGDTDREYSLFVLEWPNSNFKLGIVSHGIGASGVEIVLSEVSALVALANGNMNNPIKAVIRSGTRGSIVDIPLGSLALSTETFSEHDSCLPDQALTQRLKEAAEHLNVELVEGKCLSAQFFWTGQGRTPFPLLKQLDKRESLNESFLRGLQEKGFKWIEMEDYYLNFFGKLYGIATASLGVVIAKRYDAASNSFVLSYDAQAKRDKELLPACVALEALRQFCSQKNKLI